MSELIWNISIFLLGTIILLGTIVSFCSCFVCLIKKSGKKKYSIISFFCFLILLAMLVLYILPHMNYYRFNDWKVIGTNYLDVEKKYGEFDFRDDSMKTVGYYIHDNELGESQYYYMDYNEDGKIIRVYTAGYLIGN